MINILKIYIDKWWMPILGFIFISLFGLITDDIGLKIVVILFLILLVISLLGVIISIVFQFANSRWLFGFLSVVCFGISFIILFGIYIFSGLFISEDKFAENLTIPKDIELSEVSTWKNNHPNNKYSYQYFILSALTNSDSRPQFVKVRLNSLNELVNSHQDIFLRYISTNPYWRVFEEHGEKYATRRWNLNNNWKYDLHGYYSNFDLSTTNDTIPQFQNRFTIGLDNKPWAKNLSESTTIKNGEEKILFLSSGNNQPESHCIIKLDKCIVEIFEQSPINERVLTQSAIDYTEKEFNKVLVNPTFENIKKILPDSAIRYGEHVFELHDAIQGGIYDSEIWINPGEPGQIYLKAFELTKNTRLSASRLKEYSNEWIGWSENPNELFYSSTHFTIYEGDWDKPYAARFEIWFVPDSGGKERKLTEKIFKIEGWQR